MKPLNSLFNSTKRTLFLILVCLAGSLQNAQAQGNATLPSTVPFNINAPGLSFDSCMRYYRSQLSPSDTGEGGNEDKLAAFELFWKGRVLHNDSSGNNMFDQYNQVQRLGANYRMSNQCASNTNYAGNWSNMGPDSFSNQNLGLMNDVWVSPTDTNFILATSLGGLFKSTDAGKNWVCLTDKAGIFGSIGTFNIAVFPGSSQIIYLSTKRDNATYGSGIIYTTNGGATWQEEVTPYHNPPNWLDSIASNQRVYFSPDGKRLYALRDSSIFFRTYPIGTWTAIHPNAGATNWRNLTFVPKANGLLDSSHFFVSSEATYLKITPRDFRGSLYECNYDANTGVHTFTKINLGTIAFSPYPTDTISNYNVSIPNDHELFLLLYTNIKNNQEMSALIKYDLINHSIKVMNSPLPYIMSAWGSGNLVIAVSPKNIANLYYGADYAYFSNDTGKTFTSIGEYRGGPTHGDIRAIKFQQSAATANSIDDRVYFANDGGIALKPLKTNPLINPTYSLKNINGKGLAVGRFLGVGTSELGGQVLATQLDNGFCMYEPKLSPKWVVNVVGDAMEAVFNRTKVEAYGGNSGGAYSNYLDKTVPANGRLMSLTSTVGSLSQEPHAPLAPMWGDQFGGVYVGQTHMWRLSPTTGQFIPVSGTTYGTLLEDVKLPEYFYYYANTLKIYPPIRSMSFSQYKDSLTGYVLYSSGGGDKSNEIFYRNIYTSTQTPLNDFKIRSNHSFTLAYPANEIVCNPAQPEQVWLALGGLNYYNNNNTYRVMYSTDEAKNWDDISGGLPNHLPVTHIVYQEGTKNVYCSTDIGIYKCDMTNYNANATKVNGINPSVTWTCFNKGATGQPDFPMTATTDLEINYCEGKLYASAFGRAIWSTDLMMETPNYPNPVIGDLVPDPTDTIKVNTIWNADKVIYTGIYVMPNVTLTINSPAVIHMPKNGALVVAKGAVLNVNGAKLTNDCSGLWKGILVLGDPNLPQYPNGSGNPDPNHGIAVMTNGATIEHARIGIANYGESLSYGWNMSGGIIYTEGANITNCTRGVVFAPYQAKLNGNLIPDVSLINKVNFVVDDNYKGEDLGYYFQAHATLSNINGVRFRDNNFSNLSTKPNTKGTGSGIISWCAGYSVYPSIVSPTFGNKFWGFSIGINANAPITANNLISVDNSTFNENGIGMQMLNGSPFHAYRNLFSIGNSFNPICTSCNYNMGIYTSDNHQAIKIQENTFSNAVKNWQSIGINVTNCSSYGQTNIYKNNFANLTYGNLSIGTNKPLNSVGHVNEGLLYQCNLFNPRSLTYDIYVANGKGINPIQGGYTLSKPSVKMPSGNLFFPSPGNVFNYGDFFAYYLTGYVYENIAMPSNNIATFLIANTNTCATHLTNNPGGELLISGGGGNGCSSSTNSTTRLANYAFYNGAWSALSNELQSKMDKGNTSDLLNTILNSNDAITLRSQLLTLSPFLSRKVLKATIDNNKLPMGMMMDVLQANPEALRRDTFLNYLQYLAPNPYPQDAIILLKQYAAQTSERTEFELNIGAAYDSMKIVANGAIEQLLTDSLGYNPDTLIAWYNRIPEITARYAIAGFHLYNKDFGKMNNVFSAIPTEFNVVNENKLNEVNSLQELYGVIAGVLGRGAFDNQLSETELAQVHDIANRGHGVASQTALAYELHAKDSSIRTCPYLPEIGNNRMAVPLEDQYVRATNNVVKVFPNPAKDFVNIIYDLPLAKGIIHLTVTDLSGRNIFETTLKDNLGQTWIDTRNYSNETYLYEFKDETKSLSAGKITVTN